MAPMKCPAHRDGEELLHETCTLTHLARRWRVSRRQIRRLVQSGALPFVEITGQIRVPIRAVEQFEIEARTKLVPQ